jgi:uncharacterized 2Fe-2S/4Fe-4S cluster protein (DUF4445 family)
LPGEVTVTFAPGGAFARVAAGASLTEAARAAGVLLAAPCAGRGICGGCGVRVLSGELEPPDAAEAAALSRAPAGIRLACRARVAGDVEVQPLFATGAVAEPPVARAAVPGVPAHERALVAGVDLGTTSVAARVLEAQTGREAGSAVVPNQQASFGADVLSRLTASLEGNGEALQRLAAASVRDALDAALSWADAGEAALTRVAIAGNSVMAGLLVGADVSTLAEHPFVAPEMTRGIEAPALAQLGLPAHVEVEVIQPIASFVGGDAMAGVISAGLVDADRPTLLVDIGTNAEIVLALPSGLLVTSAAAGPAFEGRGIGCGGPATAPAVRAVRVSGESVSLETIGGGAAEWLSGAGLVSAVAALRVAGHVGTDGRMTCDGPLAKRCAANAAGVLAIELGDERHPLAISQLDIRALQLAKAAVRVGIQALLGEAGTTSRDLAEVLVAGAFGEALEPADLVSLGIVPRGSVAVTRRVGNAALDGAAALALDPSLSAIAAQAAAGARHVDLAARESFGAAFLAATSFEPYE